jgi:hypothetical protein
MPEEVLEPWANMILEVRVLFQDDYSLWDLSSSGRQLLLRHLLVQQNEPTEGKTTNLEKNDPITMRVAKRGAIRPALSWLIMSWLIMSCPNRFSRNCVTRMITTIVICKNLMHWYLYLNRAQAWKSESVPNIALLMTGGCDKLRGWWRGRKVDSGLAMLAVATVIQKFSGTASSEPYVMQLA